MKAGIRRKFQASVRCGFHPEIHPDDAEKALRAWFWRTAKSRKKPRPEAILEDAFIASLANKRPWFEDQVQMIAKLSANKDFCERFARALEHGRAKIFDTVDVFMLRNWRNWSKSVNREIAKLPALNDWNPRAACAYMMAAGLTEAEKGEGWYSTRRRRLGLPGKRRYRVTECVLLPNGDLQINPK